MNFPLARHLAWLIWRVTCLSNPITCHTHSQSHSQSHSHLYSHSHSHKCECECAWVSPHIESKELRSAPAINLNSMASTQAQAWCPRLQLGRDHGVDRWIGLRGMLIAHCNCKWHDRGNLWIWLWFCFSFRLSFILVFIIIYTTLLCENWPFFIAFPPPLFHLSVTAKHALEGDLIDWFFWLATVNR